jgi:hypothetical protein
MDLSQNPPLSSQIISECRLLKSEMNNNRKSFVKEKDKKY